MDYRHYSNHYRPVHFLDRRERQGRQGGRALIRVQHAGQVDAALAAVGRRPVRHKHGESRDSRMAFRSSSRSRRDHALFGVRDIPEVPRDGDVVTEEDLSIYVAALERNGFFGPSSWYMNHAANATYAQSAQNDGYVDMPVLFITAQYDYIGECAHSRLPEPMRNYFLDLTEETIRAGHWVAQEKPVEVNAALVSWLATAVPGVWPRPK